MLRRMAGGVEDFGCDVPQFEHVPIANPMEWKGHVRVGKEHVFGLCDPGQRAASRHVIGVEVGVYDVADAHPGFLRGAQVPTDVTDRVDDRTQRFTAASKQVRGRYGVRVQKLPQDHYTLPDRRSAYLTAPISFKY